MAATRRPRLTTLVAGLIIAIHTVVALPLFESLTQVALDTEYTIRKYLLSSSSTVSPEPSSQTDETSEFPGWFDPRDRGGRFLDYTTKRKGEPLNIIISNKSDSFILTDAGFHNYAKSVGYSGECLGLHDGHIHEANLGDGDGKKDEQFLARQYYFPVWGTCWESLAGGHHFRAWQQEGDDAPSNAWFIAASKEEDASKHHKIVDNGYDIGRDWFVEKATQTTRWKGMWWKADVEWKEGLLKPGKEGINHGIKIDGRVAILTVNRL